MSTPPLQAPAAPLPSTELAAARDELRRKSEVVFSGARLGAALLLLALSVWLGFGEGFAEWRSLSRDLALYTAAAAAVAWLSWKRSAALLGEVMPALDVLAVFALQYRQLSTSPFPAGVAGWTLGPLVFLLLIASLTAHPRSIAFAALLAWACEAALQRAAGVGAGAIVASGLVLGAAAVVTVFSARVFDQLVQRAVAKEVARRMAEAQSAEVEEARRALAAQHQALREAQHDAEQLTNFLVHDMKGPLAGIKALVSLARDALPAGTEEVDLLERADGLSMRLLGMMGDLLTISRLEGGGAAPESQQLSSLSDLLGGVRATITAQAKQQQVALSVSCPAGLAACLDAALVQRMLENLASNGLRYTHAGDRLELYAGQETTAQGQTLILAVCNSGPAIPAAIQGRLFNKGVSSADHRHNVGLGLYFCRKVAEAHGGAIGLEDRPGWNVSFVARLPLRAEEQAVAQQGTQTG
jgi:signal transduction histidine kinase